MTVYKGLVIRVMSWWAACPLNKYASLRKLLANEEQMDWTHAEPGFRSDAFILAVDETSLRERVMPFMSMAEQEVCEDALSSPFEVDPQRPHIRTNSWVSLVGDETPTYIIFYRQDDVRGPQLMLRFFFQQIGPFNRPGGYPLNLFAVQPRIERLECLGQKDFISFRKSLRVETEPKSFNYDDLRRALFIFREKIGESREGILHLKSRRRLTVNGKDVFAHVFVSKSVPSLTTANAIEYLAWREWDGPTYTVRTEKLNGRTLEEAFGIKKRMSSFERLLEENEVGVEALPDGGEGLTPRADQA